jgi:hypothetical protein
MIRALRCFFTWLGTPLIALRKHEARQAMVYLIFAGCGPALTLIVIWAMTEALRRQPLWSTFSNLAYIVAAALLVIVVGLGMFVSIRAVKIGKDGFEATGGVDDHEESK